MLLSIALGTYLTALVAAAINDLVRYEIPDMLSVALVAAFLLTAAYLPLSLSAWHALAGLATFLVAAILFATGICGGGDVKLIGATALWMGWQNLFEFLLFTALAGGVLALVLIAARKLASPERKSGHWYSRLLCDTEGVPYGVAIAAAGLVLSSRLELDAFSAAALNGGN
jgi:prepilin peptidase CpaA